jgi:5,10-methylenetetrahydromethanopterin reductase
MVEFGIEFVPQYPYWKTTYLAMLAEKMGFHCTWITDHFNNRNPYVSLSMIANYTDKIVLGPGVTNPYLVHPVVTAQAVASLTELAPARVVCGLGVGDRTTLKMLNVAQEKPLSAIREAVTIIRSLTSGNSANVEGEIFNVSGAKFFFRPSTPVKIFIGAQGPKMLMLAGEIGDGVLINASHPRDIENALKHAKQGTAKAGRSFGELAVAAYTSFSIAQDQKKAVKAVTPVVAYIVAGCPNSILQAHGVSTDAAAKIRDGIARGQWKEAFGQVTPEMVDAFSICGTPDTCMEKIRNLVKLGVTQFVVGSPIGPNVREAINEIGQNVLPAFK